MKRVVMQALAAVAIAAIFFTAGLYVGVRPQHQWNEATGGPAGHTAIALRTYANSFGTPRGHTFDARGVVDHQAQLADAQSVVVAEWYCRMTPEFRRIAQDAAARLSASALLTSRVAGRDARAYIASTNPDSSACTAFQAGSTAIRVSQAAADFADADPDQGR